MTTPLKSGSQVIFLVFSFYSTRPVCSTDNGNFFLLDKNIMYRSSGQHRFIVLNREGEHNRRWFYEAGTCVRSLPQLIGPSTSVDQSNQKVTVSRQQDHLARVERNAGRS